MQALSQHNFTEMKDIFTSGKFNLHHSSPRLARNPKTGETLHIPVKTIIHFKAGKQMRDRVNASHGKCDIIK